MNNGQWITDNGQWTTDNLHALSIVRRQLSIDLIVHFNYQLSIAASLQTAIRIKEMDNG
jgi:hypothetical protein